MYLRCRLTSLLPGIRLLSNRYRLLAANKSEEHDNKKDNQADAEGHSNKMQKWMKRWKNL